MITIRNFPRGARGVRVFWTCEEMEPPHALTAWRARLAARPAYRRAQKAQA